MLEETREGAVATLTLADPERRNALGYAEVSELLARFRALDADHDVRAVVLTGSGKAFSAGGDLVEFQRDLGASAYDFWSTGEAWAELFRMVPRLRYPVVAAVNGPALAGGCGLVALCDIAIAAASATLGLTEVRIGLFPIIVLPAVRRLVGERVLRELALTGRVLDADEAARAGLVNRVVPDDELLKVARELAAELARLAPTAIGLGKRLLADLSGLGYEDALTHARAMRGVFLHTEDLAEGVAAFVEKRRPRW